MQLTIKTQKSEGTYGLIWGTRAFRLAEKRLNMEMNEIFLSISDEDVILNLTYCALQNWLQNQDESAELPFTFVQFENWLNEQPQEVANNIAIDYQSSTLQGKSISDRYDEINAIYAAAEAKNTSPKKTVKKKK